MSYMPPRNVREARPNDQGNYPRGLKRTFTMKRLLASHNYVTIIELNVNIQYCTSLIGFGGLVLVSVFCFFIALRETKYTWFKRNRNQIFTCDSSHCTTSVKTYFNSDVDLKNNLTWEPIDQMCIVHVNGKTGGSFTGNVGGLFAGETNIKLLWLVKDSLYNIISTGERKTDWTLTNAMGSTYLMTTIRPCETCTPSNWW